MVRSSGRMVDIWRFPMPGTESSPGASPSSGAQKAAIVLLKLGRDRAAGTSLLGEIVLPVAFVATLDAKSSWELARAGTPIFVNTIDYAWPADRAIPCRCGSPNRASRPARPAVAS